MRRLGWLSIVSFAGFVACGDSGGGAETAASAADLQRMCQAMCDHDTRCRGGADPDCVPSCQARAGEPSRFSRQGLDILASCYRDPACLDDDTCEGRALTRDASVRATVEQCIDFAGTCSYEIDISLCLQAGLMVPAVRDQLRSCAVGECTSDKAAVCFAF